MYILDRIHPATLGLLRLGLAHNSVRDLDIVRNGIHKRILCPDVGNVPPQCPVVAHLSYSTPLFVIYTLIPSVQAPL